MRASVTAILVIRQGGDQLTASLSALAVQSRQPDKLVLVDSSVDSTIGPTIEGALAGASFDWDVVAVPYSIRFSEAIWEGMNHAFGEDTVIPESEWVWLLRDDVEASESTLERLMVTVEGAPLVKIAGPKQRMADRRTVIRELGETMTRFGERMTLAERERDQAQYDRLSDVLAVGEVGMVANASVLRELGGFDPGLTPLDGGLDVCVRARLAGHRVIVVPRAVVYVGAGPADWSARKKLSGVADHFLARRAWLYRRLVYAPLWLLPLLVLWVVPLAVLRAGAQLFVKRPDRMASEVVAALGALARLGSIMQSRQILAAHRVTSWATIDSLRLDPLAARKRKSIRAEASRAWEEERAVRNIQPAIFPTLPWLGLALVVVSGLVFGRWWGAEFLLGGGLVPLVESGGSVWSHVWTLTPTEWGFDALPVPADPIALLFALLGTLTWWNSHLALVWLFVAAIPAAGVVAWWGFSQLVSKAWTTTLAAFIWALSPALLLALSDGRVGAVISLIALPWLLGTLVTAHESWQRVGQASLALVVVTAATPSLWPVVVVAVLALALSRAVSEPIRVFAGFLPLVLGPALLLSLPRFLGWWEQGAGRWWDNWGVLFADPGKGTPFTPAPWWFAFGGWPEPIPEGVSSLVGVPSTVLAFAALGGGALLVGLALLSLAVGRPITSMTFGVLSATGLVALTIAPVLFSGFDGAERVFVWPGAAAGVLLLGLLVGASSALDRVEFEDSLGNAIHGFTSVATRFVGALLVVLALVAPGIMAVWAWSGMTAVSPSSAARTLPAFVAAEAAQSPQVGTLVIEATGDSYLVTLERGSGETLLETSTLVRGRDIALREREEDLARLAAMLVRPSAAKPTPLFEKYGISFVLLRDAPDSEAALTLAQRPELVSASSVESGQLWQVDAERRSIQEPETSEPGGASQWFLALLAVVAILAIPTEKRSRGTTRPLDDALPALGEETSDDL